MKDQGDRTLSLIELYESPEMIKQYEDEKKHLEGQFRMKDNEFRRIRDDLYSVVGKYRDVKNTLA